MTELVVIGPAVPLKLDVGNACPVVLDDEDWVDAAEEDIGALEET